MTTMNRLVIAALAAVAWLRAEEYLVTKTGSQYLGTTSSVDKNYFLACDLSKIKIPEGATVKPTTDRCPPSQIVSSRPPEEWLVDFSSFAAGKGRKAVASEAWAISVDGSRMKGMTTDQVKKLIKDSALIADYQAYLDTKGKLATFDPAMKPFMAPEPKKQ